MLWSENLASAVSTPTTKRSKAVAQEVALMKEKKLAYAIRVTEANIKSIILSEAGESYNVIDALKWLQEHGEGWFLRDEDSVLDCKFFRPEIFTVMYKFVDYDDGRLIHQVSSR